MINQLLVTLINSVLGSGKSTARGNYSYYCPNCKHHKRKLEINLDENSPNFQKFACWTNCGLKGKKIVNLFKKTNVGDVKLNELSLILKDAKNAEIIEGNSEILTLPKEFISLISPNTNDLTVKHALSYLKKRGLYEEDIIKYNLGYCEKGKYKNRIVIPSYDENGELNYFMTRSFDPNVAQSYNNPSISRNIIPFEFFINWNSPLILCEGPFDAMTIKRNVIPLLGKNIQNNLMKKIITSKVKKIYIVLDKDAMKNAIDHCENLMNEGKQVYLVELDKKDPSKMGFLEFTKTIQKTKQLTFSKLFEKKLELV
jgi:hypothetical protein